MSIGMLWFDNDKESSLEERVKRAVTYYKNKYLKTPDRCFVFGGQFPETPIEFDGVKVIGSKEMLPNHFWVGVSDQDEEKLTQNVHV